MKTVKALILLMAMLLSVACSNDDNAAIGVSDDTIVEPPVNDAMSVTTDMAISILDSGFSDVAEAFIKRIKHPLYEITPETKAILIKGSNINQHLSDQKIYEALANGAVMIIDQPTFKQFIDALYMVYLPGYTDADPGEDDGYIYYDMMAFDNQYNFYALNDIFDDEKHEPELKLSPYLNGLYADPVAHWVNENAGKVASGKAATRGASPELSTLMKSQNVTQTYSVRPSGTYHEHINDRQCVFTVSTNIWAAYKYDEDADYYLIEQTVLGNSSNFWVGSWTNGNWKCQGFFLSRLTINNKLFHGEENFKEERVLKMTDGAYLLDYSPSSTSGQRTTTVEESWQLSGDVGLSGTGFSGGVGGSISSSYSVEDMTITALCLNDNNCNNNAAWQFDVNTDNYNFSGWSGFSFRKPPLLGTDAYKTVQCWKWKVEHPKKYDSIRMVVDFGIDHSYNSYRNDFFSAKSQNGNFFNGWYSQYITIRPPYRGPRTNN